jgi:hypothetical protein
MLSPPYFDCDKSKMLKTGISEYHSLSQLCDRLIEPGGANISQTLLVLEQCLRNLDKVDREPLDPKDAQKLLSWLAATIKPTGDILNQENGEQIETLLSRSSIAFECMRHLQAHFLSQEQVNPDTLISIIAYTDAEDPWTLETTQRMAEEVLEYHQRQLISHDFIIKHVLMDFIRPLFSASQTPLVAPQGRGIIGQTVQKLYLRNQDASKKPWRLSEASAMTVVRWAIRNMDVSNLISVALALLTGIPRRACSVRTGICVSLRFSLCLMTLLLPSESGVYIF